MLGALAYGQLRSLEVTARAIRLAPDVRLARRFADATRDEHDRFVALYDHLRGLTDLADAVMDRQRGPFDAFFDNEALSTFPNLCALFAVGLPLTADFVARIAPALGDEQAQAVLSAALAGRDDVTELASGWLRDHLADDADRAEQMQRVVAELTGRALTSFQRVVQETDALAVVLTDGGDDAGHAVRDVVVEVLGGHRRRLAALGLGEPV